MASRVEEAAAQVQVQREEEVKPRSRNNWDERQALQRGKYGLGLTLALTNSGSSHRLLASKPLRQLMRAAHRVDGASRRGLLLSNLPPLPHINPNPHLENGRGGWPFIKTVGGKGRPRQERERWKEAKRCKRLKGKQEQRFERNDEEKDQARKQALTTHPAKVPHSNPSQSKREDRSDTLPIRGREGGVHAKLRVCVQSRATRISVRRGLNSQNKSYLAPDPVPQLNFLDHSTMAKGW